MARKGGPAALRLGSRVPLGILVLMSVLAAFGGPCAAFRLGSPMQHRSHSACGPRIHLRPRHQGTLKDDAGEERLDEELGGNPLRHQGPLMDDAGEERLEEELGGNPLLRKVLSALCPDRQGSLPGKKLHPQPGGRDKGPIQGKLALLGKFADYYELKSELNGGAFGKVYEAVHRMTNETFAVKAIDLKKPGVRQATLDEVVMMGRAATHPNVVTLHSVFEEGHTRYLVLDMCKGGDLLDFLDQVTFDAETGERTWSDGDSSFILTERMIGSIIRQVLSAVKHLLSRGIAHGDIKLENFFLRDRPSPDGDMVVMLGDFGYSMPIVHPDGSMAQPRKRYSGTLRYSSPELIKVSAASPCCPAAVDMWALGVATYFLLCRDLPFVTEHGDEQLKSLIARGWFFFPEHVRVSAEARNFVESLIVVDPAMRLNASAAAGHPWLAA